MTYRLAYRRYRLPLHVAVRTAHGVLAERTGVLVRLEDESGAVGCGEAAVLPWFGTETADEVAAACSVLGVRVTAEQLAAVPARLRCLRFALQAATGEEASAAADRQPVKAVQKPLPVAALLPAGPAALKKIAPLAEASVVPGAQSVGRGDAVPGKDAEHYAWVNVTVHRNLYRISLP